MKAIHQRFIHGDVTFSKLTLPWLSVVPDLYGIELPWKDNAHDISCIPVGVYKCTPHVSPTKGKTWILNVPNRDFILVHAGNFASTVTVGGQVRNKDTDGCLMYGFGIEESIPMITRSKEAITYLETTIGLGSTWYIEVRD